MTTTLDAPAATLVDGVGVWLFAPDADASDPATAVDFACHVDEVAIQHGRDDTSNQPEPSSCTVNFTVGPGTPMPAVLDIGAQVRVVIVRAGVTYDRFTGRVTDLALGWDEAGQDTPERGVGQMVAVGVLADYARRVVGAEPFPQELDGARVARVFAAAGLVLNPATSDPGVAQVNPRDIDARAALEVAQGAATSAGGMVWETRAGDVRYADSEHRRGAVVALELDACDVLVTPTWSRTLAGLVNDLTVAYGMATPADEETGTPAAEAPVYHAVNHDSIGRWGPYEYSVTTELATEADVSSLASLILTQNGDPAWLLSVLPVHVTDLDNARMVQLLGLDVHSLVRVSGLPDNGATPTAVASFVEGWSERLAWGVHELELSVSAYCRTAPPQRWDDTNPATTWDAVATSVTWDSMACPGGPAGDLGRWDDVAATTRWDMVDPALDWDEATAGVPT